ncbi:hypothetical protein D3C76_1316950 [compost metagenome]
MMRLSAMAIDLCEVVQEFDINPLFVLKTGEGVRAGDALAKPFSNGGEVAVERHLTSGDALVN